MKNCAHKNHTGDKPLPLSSFSKRKSSTDGHQSWCKLCSAIVARESLERRAVLAGNPLPNRHGRLSYEEQVKRRREHKRKSPQNNMEFLLRNIRGRCKKTDIPFNITVDDFNGFPTHCPDLKVELIYGNEGKASPRSATVDRIIPHLGYVPGNVRIVSYKANVMKQDASFEEMKTIAESWLRLYTESVFTHQAATQTASTGVKNDVQGKISSST